jgi:hypothetical protein
MMAKAGLEVEILTKLHPSGAAREIDEGHVVRHTNGKRTSRPSSLAKLREMYHSLLEC